MRREILPFYIAVILSIFGILGLLPDRNLVLKQAMYNLIGIALFIYVSRINVRTVVLNSHVLYHLALLLLFAVLIFGSGPGVRRWFDAGVMKIQPSELAKVFVPLYLIKLDGTAKRFFLGSLAFALVLLEPDLATSSVILALTLYVIFITEKDPKIVVLLFSSLFAPLASFFKTLFLGFMGVLIAVLVFLRASLAWTVLILGVAITTGLITPVIWEKGLKEYQRKRIIAMFKPRGSEDILWQARQSRITLANSGPFGKGISGATQKNYGFLPASHTDFAFSSMVEMYGYVPGALLLLLLYLLPILLFYLSFSSDPYVYIVSSTAGVFFLYQTSVNLLSVFGVLPIAGIPLPFIAYGGSHLISEWLWLALAYSSYRWKVES